jgi:chromosome segregation ATPase
MIEKMVFHLMSEQTDEDNHKNWCDKELETTTMMIEDKNATKEELQASIDELTAEIESLDSAIKENAVAIAEIDASVEEQTATRAEDKAENLATIKDAEEAQSAVSEAIAVLEEFYKSTGEVAKEAWEFSQMKAKVRRVQQAPGETEPMPEMESQPYTGTEGGSGVIGMLQDIATDFASMETEARADETTQQDEYDEEMTALKTEKAGKESDTNQKTGRMERMKEKLVGKKDDFKHNQKELDATNQYWADLQHACVDGDSTYEDRKAARTQEIEALKEAQGILEKAFDEPEEGEASPAPA